jgi:hypothetical protein
LGSGGELGGVVKYPRDHHNKFQRDTDGETPRLYQVEKKSDAEDPTDPSVGENVQDRHMVTRAVASSELDKLLQLGVVSEEKFGVDDQNRVFGISVMADGAGIQSEFRAEGPGSPKIGCFLNVDYSNPVIQKGLSDLEVSDYISGQIDRHAGNIFVDGTTGKVTGIDNDLSFPEASRETIQARESDRLGSTNNKSVAGMPRQIHADTRNKILAVDPDVMRQTLAGIRPPNGPDNEGGLTEAEIEGAVGRLQALQDELRNPRSTIQVVTEFNDATYEAALEAQKAKFNEVYDREAAGNNRATFDTCESTGNLDQCPKTSYLGSVLLKQRQAQVGIRQDQQDRAQALAEGREPRPPGVGLRSGHATPKAARDPGYAEYLRQLDGAVNILKKNPAAIEDAGLRQEAEGVHQQMAVLQEKISRYDRETAKLNEGNVGARLRGLASGGTEGRKDFYAAKKLEAEVELKRLDRQLNGLVDAAITPEFRNGLQQEIEDRLQADVDVPQNDVEANQAVDPALNEPQAPNYPAPLPPGQNELQPPNYPAPLPPGMEPPNYPAPLPPGQNELQAPNYPAPLPPGMEPPNYPAPLPPGQDNLQPAFLNEQAPELPAYLNEQAPELPAYLNEQAPDPVRTTLTEEQIDNAIAKYVKPKDLEGTDVREYKAMASDIHANLQPDRTKRMKPDTAAIEAQLIDRYEIMPLNEQIAAAEKALTELEQTEGISADDPRIEAQKAELNELYEDLDNWETRVDTLKASMKVDDRKNRLAGINAAHEADQAALANEPPAQPRVQMADDVKLHDGNPRQEYELQVSSAATARGLMNNVPSRGIDQETLKSRIGNAYGNAYTYEGPDRFKEDGSKQRVKGANDRGINDAEKTRLAAEMQPTIDKVNEIQQTINALEQNEMTMTADFRAEIVADINNAPEETRPAIKQAEEKLATAQARLDHVEDRLQALDKPGPLERAKATLQHGSVDKAREHYQKEKEAATQLRNTAKSELNQALDNAAVKAMRNTPEGQILAEQIRAEKNEQNKVLQKFADTKEAQAASIKPERVQAPEKNILFQPGAPEAVVDVKSALKAGANHQPNQQTQEKQTQRKQRDERLKPSVQDALKKDAPKQAESHGHEAGEGSLRAKWTPAAKKPEMTRSASAPNLGRSKPGG